MGLDIRAVSQAVRCVDRTPANPSYATSTEDDVREYPAQADGLPPGYYRVQGQQWFTAAPGYDGTYNELVQVLVELKRGSLTRSWMAWGSRSRPGA